ncbi:MAG: tRNA dihydrouridine(20/20a) synthase DusA [Hyphomicrobiaceae bacterium]
MQYQSHRFCVAPMMDWTDRHCRVFHRQLTRHAMLYTEMVTADAIIRGDRERLIGHDAIEHPIALQLGGADPAKLADAARIGEERGYDEINLNVGCPSDRVQGGNFGACLMADPALVARAVTAMREAVDIRVTVKCRIGIDDQDSEADFANFIDTVADAGCQLFIVHARKAWLQGLSPKQNREVPPLDYDRVYRLKAARPELTIILNGGITTLVQGQAHLAHVDGVMLGRAAYQTPWILASVDALFFDDPLTQSDRDAVLSAMARYADKHIARGGRLNNVTRHMLGLYHGQPGGRLFRRYIAEHVDNRDSATGDVLRGAGRLVAETREAMFLRRQSLTSVE